MGQHLDVFGPEGAGQLEAGPQQATALLIVLFVAVVVGHRLGLRSGSGNRALVHHGEHGPHQGEAVPHGVMKAHHQRLAAEGGVYQVHLPERTLVVEGGGGKVGHQPLQLGLAGLARQDHPLEMQVEIEIGVGTPVVLSPFQAGFLREARLYPYGVQQALAQSGFIQLTVEHQHADDLHQVVGPVHPQPGGIDTGDEFTHRHVLSLSFRIICATFRSGRRRPERKQQTMFSYVGETARRLIHASHP